MDLDLNLTPQEEDEHHAQEEHEHHAQEEDVQ
jgi:hypothetical protein